MNKILKPSKYNTIIPLNDTDTSLIFNSLTTGLIEVKNSDLPYFQDKILNIDNIKSVDTRDYLIKLYENGYLVDKDIDELKLVEYFYNNEKNNTDMLSITIAPTYNCNCKCSYCFEKNIPKEIGKMDLKVQDELINYIENKINDIKYLNIVWFGGEPLLCLDIIERINSKLLKLSEDHNVDYSSSMTTNGILLTKHPETINLLKNLKLKYIQVTLDGSKDEHNKIRITNNNGNTFDDIIECIKLLKKNKFNINVRVNIDKNNVNNIEELFNTLVTEHLEDIPISLGHLRNYSEENLNDETYFTMEEFSKKHVKIYQILKEKRFTVGVNDYLPVLTRPCIANRFDSFIIDYKGDLYKCRTLIGNDEACIGNIFNIKGRTVEENYKEIKWLMWNPFDYEKCRSCNILPICMGDVHIVFIVMIMNLNVQNGNTF